MTSDEIQAFVDTQLPRPLPRDYRIRDWRIAYRMNMPAGARWEVKQAYRERTFVASLVDALIKVQASDANINIPEEIQCRR